MPTLVECRICGHKAPTLAKHFKPAHGITCGEYRLLYPNDPIRGEGGFQPQLKERPRLRGKGARFTGLRWDEEGEPILEGLLEGYHYVHCAACGKVAEDLGPHLQQTHPELVEHYDDVFRGQPIRSKYLELAEQRSTLKGRVLPAEVRAKMSANAGRWNAGLTKDTDERVASQAAKMAGRTPWSKGRTKEDHPSLRATAEKLSRWSGEQRYWSNGLRADLSEVDFTPYLDETGAVDRRRMAEELGFSEPTITKYMEAVGLRLSTKYVDARAERQKVCIEKADLERFRLANGKVVVAQAMVGLGHGFKAIKRECERHGLETFHHRVRQTLCLDAVSKALGGVPYEQEWSPRRFTNPATGRRFRFDGYFPSHNLVTEFHGYQHWTFPSVYIKDEALYFALQERDRIKENLILQDPTLRYFLVRESEPYADPVYLQARLLDEGYLDP